MKWIYGKQDVKSLERGAENCFLLTNGLGGFSSLTITGGASRNDHALLMACIQAPNRRYNMVHRLCERLEVQEADGIKVYEISSQEFLDGHQENGYEYLSSFVFEETPVWRFLAGGLEIRKEIGMKQGENTVALRYEVTNRGRSDCKLSVIPFFQFTPKGSDAEGLECLKRTGMEIGGNGLTLYFRTNGVVEEIPETIETYYYSYDVCDGRRESGMAKADHEITLTIKAGESQVLELVYEMSPGAESAAEILDEAKRYREDLVKKAGLTSPIAQTLVKSAAQFVSKRESTGGDTILAGYPFFEDWGRDTMIALPGVCIATGQYETAKRILRTFAVNERNGLMPNLFPEGGNDPLYNTVDAALLFINCVYLYYDASQDAEFVAEMYPVMERIVAGYQKGTEFGIHMDADGLIQAGEGLSQVTWMDVRVGDFLPTPRHGKPVEINAYWYNALCIMEQFADLLGRKDTEYGKLAGAVKHVFSDLFWMEEKGCLKDLVSGTDADTQIRCNQIWAVSMPFTILDKEKECRVVETVFEKLYTPYGLRTLEQADKEFHAFYGGPVEKRDRAYHQGTVWTFPLGAYYLAYLKVHEYSTEAKKTVAEQLEVMESALREGCIGQLPEIYDGGNPTSSRGCFAQAWSVGEILRVYEMLEKK